MDFVAELPADFVAPRLEAELSADSVAPRLEAELRVDFVAELPADFVAPRLEELSADFVAPRLEAEPPADFVASPAADFVAEPRVGWRPRRRDGSASGPRPGLLVALRGGRVAFRGTGFEPLLPVDFASPLGSAAPGADFVAAAPLALPRFAARRLGVFAAEGFVAPDPVAFDSLRAPPPDPRAAARARSSPCRIFGDVDGGSFTFRSRRTATLNAASAPGVSPTSARALPSSAQSVARVAFRALLRRSFLALSSSRSRAPSKSAASSSFFARRTTRRTSPSSAGPAQAADVARIDATRTAASVAGRDKADLSSRRSAGTSTPRRLLGPRAQRRSW